jgi:hypothetical protein
MEGTKKYCNYKEELRFENLRIFELAGQRRSFGA